MVETTTFTHDGTELAALLFRPDGSRGPVPAVIAAQGFGNIKDVLLPVIGEHLAAAGVATLAFDYAGFGDRAGEPRQRVDPNAQLAGYGAALSYLSELDGIDPERLGVFGISLAGGHVIRLAATDDRVRCALAVGPFFETNSAEVPAELLDAIIADAVAREQGETYGTIPIIGQPGDLAVITEDRAADILIDAPPNLCNEVTLASLVEMSSYKPLDGVEALRAPLRVVLGSEDSVNPAAISRAALAPFAGVDYVELPAGHFSIFTDHLDDLLTATVEWFTRTL